jgi:hypothetical protein
MFGKRKTPVQAAAAKADQPAGIGTFETVIVPRSAVAAAAADPSEGYKLVGAVVNFVNAMIEEGLYTRFEIHPKAVQAFHADYYLAQVNNGGHSQFIHNSGNNLDFAVADARTALAAIDAPIQAAILDEFAGWLAQNRGTPAEGIAPEAADLLHALDTRFYAAEKTAPMTQPAARWIAAWPELRAIDDADYPEAIRLSATLNPQRDSRLMKRTVARLNRQMTDRLFVGAGLACANAPGIEAVYEIGFGSVMEIEGVKQRAFHVRTSTNAIRLCVVDEKHAAAYEYVEPDNPRMPKFGDVEGFAEAIRDGRLQDFKAPSAGRKLSEIRPETIAGVIELAAEYRAAAALDLLLRKASVDARRVHVTPRGIEIRGGAAVVTWLILAGSAPLVAMSGPKGSALFQSDGVTQVAFVPESEVVRHAEQAKPDSHV